MALGGNVDNQDSIFEASMGVSESELYRACVAKCHLANHSPQQHRESGGRTRQISCANPPDDFGDGLVDGCSAEHDVLGEAGVTGRGATMPPPHPSELPHRSSVGATHDADRRASPFPQHRPDYADPSKLSKRQRDLLH